MAEDEEKRSHTTGAGEKRAPATGAEEPEKTELSPEEGPIVRGTVFLTLILLMAIFGFWILMYWMMLNR